MKIKNEVAIVLTKEDKKKVGDALKAIEEVLNDHLITLKKEERQELPKMGERMKGFVEKTIEYVNSHTEFKPDFMDKKDLEIDFNSVKDLQTIFKRINRLSSRLDDTMLLAGSEAYLASLVYYRNVRFAASEKLPGAKEVYADLKKHFNRSKPKKKKVEVSKSEGEKISIPINKKTTENQKVSSYSDTLKGKDRREKKQPSTGKPIGVID